MSVLITPNELHTALPITQKCVDVVKKTRHAFQRIANQQDDRLVVIVGPCSIHDAASALQYARQLKTLIDKHNDTLCIIMRTYLEKARTSVGWKGFIHDPDLNDTFQIEKGLLSARQLLLAINEMHVPTATEMVNPLTAQYFSDLMSWSAIGARTTESQIHRELASHLPMPVGFKNTTQGDIQVAIDAVQAAYQPHHYFGADSSGKIAVLQSTGNAYAHVVLRGSTTQTNYDCETIERTHTSLKQSQLIDRVLIDCSHGNSQKNHLQQIQIIRALSQRIQQKNEPILGVMLESHLVAGKQAWTPHQPMRSDQSITDACIGWSDTEAALAMLSDAVKAKRFAISNGLQMRIKS